MKKAVQIGREHEPELFRTSAQRWERVESVPLHFVALNLHSLMLRVIGSLSNLTS
jgi:hypothetical protein